MTGVVVVTGASTPLGVGLVNRLLEDGAAGVLAVIRPGEPEPDLRRDPRLRVEACDLLRARSIDDLLHGPGRELGAEALVHTAFHRSARDSGARVHRLNVESTREILRVVENHPTLRRFVLVSHAEIYQARADAPSIIGEDHPLELSPEAPQWIRDRVEADLIACTRMGMSETEIAVLRCAECVAPDSGSQLFDFLGSRVCFRPMGFDPMMNLLSLLDMVDAVDRAVRSDAVGIFNIPGADCLPLSEAVRRAGRVEIPAPGPLLLPLYGLRALVRHTDFRYDQNAWRFHFSGTLDGRRAREVLGYAPRHHLDWAALRQARITRPPPGRPALGPS